MLAARPDVRRGVGQSTASSRASRASHNGVRWDPPATTARNGADQSVDPPASSSDTKMALQTTGAWAASQEA